MTSARSSHLYTSEDLTSPLMNSMSQGIIAYVPSADMPAVSGITTTETDIISVSYTIAGDSMVIVEGSITFTSSAASDNVWLRTWTSASAGDRTSIDGSATAGQAATIQGRCVRPMTAGTYVARMSLLRHAGTGTLATVGLGELVVKCECLLF